MWYLGLRVLSQINCRGEQVRIGLGKTVASLIELGSYHFCVELSVLELLIVT